MELRICAVFRSEFRVPDNRGSALRLRLQVPDRTLTAPEVGEIQACCTQKEHASTGAALRD